MTLVERAITSLERAGVAPGERVGAAVSGGADSTALLHVLACAAREVGITVHALHVDHGLRDTSAREARFVAALATDLGVPFTVRRVAVQRPPRGSLEAAAREARYGALEAAAREAGCPWIATGHTLDDQAETVILRMLRGTGTGGLGGIPPVQGTLIRPLLSCTGAEVRAWLAERGIDWQEDPSNRDLSMERNWVRHVLLPEMQTRRAGVARTLARLAEHARADEAHLDDLAEEAFSRVEAAPWGVLLGERELRSLPRALATRVVRKAFLRCGHEATAAEVDEALALIDRPPVRRTGGSPTPGVWRFPEGLAFLCDPRAPEPARLPASGSVEVPRWGVRVRIGGAPDPARGPSPWRWRYELGEAAAPELRLRARHPGDRVPTAAGTRKVQDVLVDAKVPRPLRDLVPVLTRGDEPVAVVGLTAPPVRSERGTRSAGQSPLTVVDVEPLPGGLWRRAGWWTPESS